MAVCERVIEALGGYVGGDLPAPARAGVRRHLAACSACAAAAAEYRAVIRLAGALPPPAPGPAVAARLLAGLRVAAGLPACGSMDETRLETPIYVSGRTGGG